MAEPVVIVGVGMMTAVGLSAPETTAAVRAGVTRFAETPIRDYRFEPTVLAEVIEDGLPGVDEELEKTSGLTSRETRMLRLGMMPLRESIVGIAGTLPPPGLVLALPDLETTRPLDRALFLKRFAQQCGRAFDVTRSDATDRGRAGGLTAIGRAAQAIQNGQASFLVAGGIDSYRDLYVLATLDIQQRVKSAVHLDGFIPGEGAAFVLLASRAAAESAGLAALGSVSPVVTGFENGHLGSEEPYRGDGLAATISKLLQSGAAAAPIEEVYSSMNGESHWGKEWGVSFIRNSAAFRPGHRMQHPADCCGDIGAACAALMVGMAALGIAQRYRGSPSLVYCSSDSGARAAAVVSAT